MFFRHQLLDMLEKKRTEDYSAFKDALETHYPHLFLSLTGPMDEIEEGTCVCVRVCVCVCMCVCVCCVVLCCVVLCCVVCVYGECVVCVCMCGVCVSISAQQKTKCSMCHHMSSRLLSVACVTTCPTASCLLYSQ